jgi:hypothetical protein
MSSPAYPWEIILLSAALLSNRLTARFFHLRASLFWGVQVCNIGMAVFVVRHGLPGLGQFDSITWMIAALLAFHVAQNFGIREKYARDARMAATEREHRRLLRAAGRDMQAAVAPDRTPEGAPE